MFLSERQRAILTIFERGAFAISEVLEKLSGRGYQISKITLNRELKFLEENNYITVTGRGKASSYQLSNSYKLIRPIDFAWYFSINPDDRQVQDSFNHDIFSSLSEIFTEAEITELNKLQKLHLNNINKSSKSLSHKELERLLIELSWKSSRLEGNTYTLLDTEKLITKKITSEGHSKEEAAMILNHKKALDYVIKHKAKFKQINIKQIQKIQSLLVEDLDIATGFRTKKVGILGTSYKPLKSQAEIKQAMLKLCKSINQEPYPLAKALISLAMISYLQAFEDGNKRTARIVSTALLLAYNYCPLSYRNVDEYDYKKSLILFYEQNNLVYLKRIFMDQVKFSVNEYF